MRTNISGRWRSRRREVIAEARRDRCQRDRPGLPRPCIKPFWIAQARDAALGADAHAAEAETEKRAMMKAHLYSCGIDQDSKLAKRALDGP